MQTLAVYNMCNIPGFVDILRNNFDETLKINKVNYTTKNNESYSIIRYNKELITDDVVPSLGMLKSFVFNNELKAIGFAPPKSLDYKRFQKLYPIKTDFIVGEEFVEGVMINLFWNPKMNFDGGWEISTRNTVGGYIFCNNVQPRKTYADLFKDAIAYANLDIHELNKSYCYSFVMKHPDIYSISHVAKPELYLVEIYEIVQTLKEIILVFQMNVNVAKEKIHCLKTSNIRFPEQYCGWNNYSDLKKLYASTNASHSFKGVILRNLITGERSKIVNPAHNYIRLIKRVGEKELYKYLVVRKEGKVKEFLKMYPVEKKKWSIFRDLVHSFTEDLYENYTDCYVKKLTVIENIPKIFRTSVQQLHEIYIHQLMYKKQCISETFVRKYVNELDPDILFFLLKN